MDYRPHLFLTVKVLFLVCSLTFAYVLVRQKAYETRFEKIFIRRKRLLLFFERQRKGGKRKAPCNLSRRRRDALAARFYTAGQQTRPGKPVLKHVDPCSRLKSLHSAALQWNRKSQSPYNLQDITVLNLWHGGILKFPKLGMEDYVSLCS